jgi:hypothetical protein
MSVLLNGSGRDGNSRTAPVIKRLFANDTGRSFGKPRGSSQVLRWNYPSVTALN